MNCDQVFSVLTRGPFPTGHPSDVAVEVHLERCCDCWRFAEALRPAHDLFEESAPACEARTLPGYWGDAQPARSVYAEVQASALRTATLPRARRYTQATGAAPQIVHEPIGWRDIVGISGFVVLLSCAAMGVAWLWR